MSLLIRRRRRAMEGTGEERGEEERKWDEMKLKRRSRTT